MSGTVRVDTHALASRSGVYTHRHVNTELGLLFVSFNRLFPSPNLLSVSRLGLRLKFMTEERLKIEVPHDTANGPNPTQLT